RVNAVLPGLVITEMTLSQQNVYTKEYIKALDKKYPLGIGTVQDVVEPILFLLSTKSKWITGSGVIVDGGASL
ncbi:SDR family oxidoreductase, partial [Candidatus Woesearchaeota archaeon]|nr:SDR family oxidoreductase [Candidatus Woesearchaeota archaeon]